MSVDATTPLVAETAAARCYAALPPETWLPTRAICERAGLGYVSDGPLWTLYRHGRVTAQSGPPVRLWCRKELDMSETKADYHTDRDSGDETDVRLGADAPPLPGTWVGRFDAAYWQAQAETAIRALEQAQDTGARVEAERDAALRELADAQEDSREWLAELQALRGATEPELDTIRGKLTSVLAERDAAQAELTAALAQLAALREQLVTAESRCTSLRTALNRTNGLLSDERRAAAVQYRRSHLD